MHILNTNILILSLLQKELLSPEFALELAQTLAEKNKEYPKTYGLIQEMTYQETIYLLTTNYKNSSYYSQDLEFF